MASRALLSFTLKYAARVDMWPAQNDDTHHFQKSLWHSVCISLFLVNHLFPELVSNKLYPLGLKRCGRGFDILLSNETTSQINVSTQCRLSLSGWHLVDSDPQYAPSSVSRRNTAFVPRNERIDKLNILDGRMDKYRWEWIFHHRAFPLKAEYTLDTGSDC